MTYDYSIIRRINVICQERADAGLIVEVGLSQIATGRTTIGAIMRSREFKQGVADVRTGKVPRFDEADPRWQHWNYERGRLWAALAPRSMPLMLAGRLNPRATDLFAVNYTALCPDDVVTRKELLR
jgi:hypothetical protein